MQDRFKYRVKLLTDNKIELFNVTQIDYTNKQIYFKRKDGNLYNIGFGVDGVKLLQSTGLFDMDNRLIYEDDILEDVDTKKMYKVVPDLIGSGFYIQRINPEQNEESSWNLCRSRYDYKIIGKSYEIPEELEKN